MSAARGAVGAGIAALILAAALTASCSCGSDGAAPAPGKADAARPWVCEACEHAFEAPTAKGIGKCPSCGEMAAVCSMLYKCIECGEDFEAYRFLDCQGMASPKDPAGKRIAPGFYFKKKGGRWVQDEEMLGEIACPHCGNTSRAKMEVVHRRRPGS